MDVQQLFKNLKKEAECPLCKETVKNPKTLPCLHSFCLECLDKQTSFARRELQITIKCPVCQTSFHIPEGGSFINLPTSFHLNRLVDLLALKDGSAEQTQKCSSCGEKNTATSYCFVCQNVLCKSCFEAHQRLKATRGHSNILIEKLEGQDVEELIQRPVACQQQYHENQPIEFFCEDCKVPICQKCSVESHNRHTITDTQKAAQIRKMKIADALEKVKAEFVTNDDEIKKQIDFMSKNETEIMSGERKVTDTVKEVIDSLQQHERKMKTKFHEIYEVEQKQHATRLEDFEILATQLESFVERTESMLEINVSAEILQANQAILEHCEELLNAAPPEICKSPHVYYLLENTLKILDRIVVSKTDPLMSLTEGQSKEKELKEKTETNFTIVTRDSDGLQCYEEQ